jgi:hypothetical protein
MSNAIISQVSKNLPFRYRITCHQLTEKPKGLFELPVACRLPALSDFEGQKSFGDLRIGWMEDGLYLSLLVTGKKQSLWCRETQLHESDGLQIWIDTRATHNVHRASKFCHWMMMLPTGGGASNDAAMVRMLKINRSRDDSPTINKAKIDIKGVVNKDGYQISAFIGGAGLFGWNTAEHRQLGFNFAIVDRELGWQTLALGPELPIAEDPSLWQTLLLS